uniref:Phosphoinositide phospholipase C n=1 Tax=Mycena chlorophos TaxID=658473 RepID=A0ABQ0LVG0_MYCCL|nr:predicted protein [Mycena chlorophos]
MAAHTTPAPDPILTSGVELTKINSISSKATLFRVDEPRGLIIYESSKHVEIATEDIREIRTGSDAQHYCQLMGFTTAELDRWMSVVYVANGQYKTLHILAPNPDVLLRFECIIRKLNTIRAGLAASLNDTLMRESVWDAQYFELGAGQDSQLSLDELQSLCIRLNAHISRSELEALFKTVDTDHTNSLNFQQFQHFVRLLKRRPDIEALHKRLCGEAPFDFSVFEKFMKESQKSELTSDQLKALFTKYASTPAAAVPPLSAPAQSTSISAPPSGTPNAPPPQPASPAHTMGVEDLGTFLMLEDSSAVKPPATDMSLPISDYWISTSHNTYLVGNQLMGVSTVEGYIRALLCGCRSVELDIYDGPQGPVVYHGGTFTSRVTVFDICNAIAKYAFVASPLPVTLSCEVHCGVAQQDMLVDIMMTAFGGSLVRVPNSEEHAKIAVLPSPEALKGRIMVKTKNLLLSQGIESIAAHKKAAKAAATKAAHLEVESSESESSQSESEAQVVMDEARAEIGKLKNKWRKIRGEVPSGSTDTTSKHKPAMSLALASLLVYTVGVKYRGIGKSDTYTPEQIFSLSENKINKLIKTGGADLENFIRHTQKNVYWAAGCQLVALNIQTMDLGWRINQAMFMRCGRQGYVLKPPALRDPTFKLLQKRTQGYLDVTIISAQQLPVPKDKSGREIVEKSNIDPYVEVVLHIPAWSEKPFLPEDASYKHTPPSEATGSAAARKISFATTAVKNNGFNPMFQTEMCLPFDCLGGMRELIFVEFIVKQDKSMEPLASFMAPLSSLQQGFRHITLHDAQLLPHLFSTLFVYINIREV